MQKIAIVDDDTDFLKAIVDYLIGRGYDAYGFHSFRAAEKEINNTFCAALIDLHLSDGDGFELVHEVKQKYPQVHIIVFTAFDSLPKRLRSFGIGADDYMKKPIFPAELDARMKRLICRPKRKNIEIGNHSVLLLQDLSPLETFIVELLFKSQGALVPVESFVNAERSRCAVYTAISRLKQKLPQQYQIKTVYGRGWYMVTEN